MSTTEFNAQFDSVTASLNAFAMNLTKDIENARDLFQETAVRALKNKEKFRPGTNFKAWIMTMMKNIFINNYRMRRRRKVQNEPTGSLAFERGDSFADNAAESQITQKELMAMINRLDEQFRVPFWKYYTGFSYQEIADELGKPLGTIKSRIFHARKKLQAMVNSNYV
ncbi:MAG: RNA polymerase sigma factor [Bacteroidota bacterium]